MSLSSRGYKRVNSQASIKLDIVANALANAVSEDVEIITSDSDSLTRRLLFSSSRYSGEITIKYFIQNKLFASIYDLVVSFIVTGTRGVDATDVEAFMPRRGTRKIILKRQSQQSASQETLEQNLNNELIIERLNLLEIQALSLVYCKASNRWQVEFTSLVGSSAWSFIPPIMKLIEPTHEECVRFIELVKLIEAAL